MGTVHLYVSTMVTKFHHCMGGIYECLVALIGKHHGESEKAQELGLKIVTYMRDRANEFSEQYHHKYSILATPAEGLSGKFTK